MKVLLVIFALFFATTSAQADRARLLETDRDALQARVDLIQQAKSEILIEYFSVWKDDQSISGIALLLDAARRGVKVKVVIDALANKIPRSYFATLMEHGKDAQGNVNIEFRLYNPFTLNLQKLTHRDHSKLFIVDGEKMITGGRNVGDKYFGFGKKRNFRDLDIILDGPAVKDAREDFLAVFNSDIVKNPVKDRHLPSNVALENCERPQDKDRQNCEKRKKVTLKTYKEALQRLEVSLDKIVDGSWKSVVESNTGTDWLAGYESEATIEFLSHKPDELVTKKTAYMSYELEKIIRTAQDEINIMSPYFIPTKEVMALLQELIYRGVKIRVVTNSVLSTDNFFAQAAYISMKEQVIAMGVELWEYNGPDTAHGKAFVMDNKLSFVGSFNLDPRSIFLNREVGVIIRNSPEIVEDLRANIEGYRKNSLLVGKDGQPQNIEEQKIRIKSLNKGKRALLGLIRLFVPVFKNQAY
jgi:putative cardiolipin synthase